MPAHRLTRLGASALVLAALLAATLAYATSGDAQPQAPQASAEERLNLGVVAIEAKVGGDQVLGSGTVIDAGRGLVLTSIRAVWGATSLKLSTGLGIVHGRIVARAPCDGLALVETQPRIPGLISLADRTGDVPAPNQLVTAYGRRLTRGTSGILTLPARVTGPQLTLDAPLVPEAGGGPVLDAQGRLVGIGTQAGTTIPWVAIKLSLDGLVPGVRRVFAGWQDQYDCAARLSRVTKAEHPGFQLHDVRLAVEIPATRVPGSEEVDEG
jgi:S1-C subfamily serine protease